MVCRINGYPSSDPCVRMPPGDAYWAFFHAKRGGSWVYSSSGVASYDPAPGTVVGFRFGSGQQPRVAPPAPTKTSAPVPTKKTAKPTKTTKATSKPTPKRRPGPAAPAEDRVDGPGRGGLGDDGGPAPHPRRAPRHPARRPSTPSATDDVSASPSATASDLAAAPTSGDADDGNGPGTLIAGAALVLLVAGGAAYAARKRRA